MMQQNIIPAVVVNGLEKETELSPTLHWKAAVSASTVPLVSGW